MTKLEKLQDELQNLRNTIRLYTEKHNQLYKQFKDETFKSYNTEGKIFNHNRFGKCVIVGLASPYRDCFWVEIKKLKKDGTLYKSINSTYQNFEEFIKNSEEIKDD